MARGEQEHQDSGEAMTEDRHSTLHPTGHRDRVQLAKTPNPTAQSHPQLP